MSEFNETPVETAETAPVKKPFNKKKAIIASVVAGVLVIAGVVGVNAFRNKPEVRVASAFANLFSDKDIQLGIHVHLTQEMLDAYSETDGGLLELNRPGINNLNDASKALDNLELRISNFDESATDDKLSSRMQLVYGDKSIIDLSLINRVLFLSSEAASLPSQSPQLVSQGEVDGALNALSMYSALAPQLSGAIDALVSGKPIALRLDKGTALGDAFDEYMKSSQDTGLNSKTLDALLEANSNALRDSASVKEVLGQNFEEARLQGITAFDMTIDMYKYLKAMKKPLKNLAKDQLSVLGTDLSSFSSDYTQGLNKFKGQKLDFRIWMDEGNQISRLDFYITHFLSGKDLSKRAAWISFRMSPSNIEVPTDYYDLTDDLLSLGLI